MESKQPYVVIGLGNHFRGDDSCGLTVAQELDRRGLQNVRVVDSSADGTAMIAAWDNAEAAIIIDCVRSGAPAGEVFRFDALRTPLPEALFRSTSTHRLGVSQVIRLAEALGRLPRHLVVFGIEGNQFDRGAAMTPAVAQASHRLVDQVIAEIAALSQPIRRD